MEQPTLSIATLNYGNEKRRPFVNVERRMLNYDNVKQRRVENVEQQNLRFGTVKFNVNVGSVRRNPTFENGKPRWFVNVEQQNLSRVTYAAPYMHLPKTARKQIDAIIRKAYKVALGLPNHTSTARFDQLGIHNTFQELCDAQRAAQISRLSRTPTGRRTLHRAGIDYKDKPPPKWDMQPDWRRAVVVRPLPRNMSTTHHKQRREARARALQRLQEDDPRAFHVDASPYPDRSKSYVAAVHNISGSYTATIKACDIHEAEEAAIAIGLLAASRTGSSGTVTTDSKTAATSFLYGRIGSPARKILRSFRTPRDKNSRYHVVWVPAHAGHEGNEAAHSLASRVATSRDCEEEGGREFSLGEHSYAAPATEEAPTRFCDATQVERERRRVLPPPHPELNHQQARRWRQLQTLAIQTPRFLRRVHPLLFDGSCTRCCGSKDPTPDGTIGHMFWSCPKFQPPQELQRYLDDRGEDIVPHWTSLLQSDELRIQLLLIDRTEQVVRDLQDELRKRRAQL
ncbi:hypothetical protein HPB47_016168 [Ixodes persulcatus]|uniref:Uncharacterized protein n=1 Tax=Ixodes persulcatus TaxID=34615 RepID=A0AC60R2I5_IXOPE|nr:hypothetical protein HPB47_016168 [Ixodes persulcatus]